MRLNLGSMTKDELVREIERRSPDLEKDWRSVKRNWLRLEVKRLRKLADEMKAQEEPLSSKAREFAEREQLAFDAWKAGRVQGKDRPATKADARAVAAKRWPDDRDRSLVASYMDGWRSSQKLTPAA